MVIQEDGFSNQLGLSTASVKKKLGENLRFGQTASA